MTFTSPCHPARRRLSAPPAALALAVPLAAVLTAVLGGPARAATDPGSVPPQQDPFYSAPAGLGSYANGQIVATRPLTPKSGLDASKVSAWQISYRTNDSHDAAELTVTTLVVPKTAWTGTGARPVVSAQMPEDSTGLQCSPSYSFASDLSGAGVYGTENGQLVQPLLDQGWAVAIPDFEGPKSVFMAGVQAGHAVLDGLKAVRGFAPGGVTAASPVELYGYSGGAEATGWGAQLQPSYAPDVKIIGTSMGGTPSDPAAVARFLDGGLFSGFEAAAAFSYDLEYPEANLDGILNDAGRAAKPQAQGQCLGNLLLNFPFRKLSDFTTVPDPLSVPAVAAVLKANTLGAAAPTSPIFDYHATSDEIVPAAQDDTLVKNWCALGARVVKVRNDWNDHITEMATQQSAAIGFLSDRLAGKAAPSTC
jgi:hypothetical protein